MRWPRLNMRPFVGPAPRWVEVDSSEYRMAGLANPSPNLMEAFGATSTASGERVTVEKMLRDSAVYSAIRKIAFAGVAMCPFKVYRRRDDDDREEARAHRSWRLLHDKPNPHTTAGSFWSVVAIHLLAWENAYIRKLPDPFGVVDSLYLLDPSAVTVEWDGLRKTYVERLPDTGQKVRWREEDVLHIPGFSLDGLAGISRAELCRETLATSLARQKFEGAFYRRGAKLPGVIEHPGRLGKDGISQLSDSFKAYHAGVEQMHGVPVLEEGASFKPVSMSMADMQFVELRQQTLTEIAVMFDLPPAYLGASTGDSLTYATTESNQIQFAQMAVAPLLNLIQQAVSQDPELLPQGVMYAEFVLEGLLRADMKTRAEYWQTMKTLLNLDPAFIAARENIPASAIKEPEPTPAPLAPPPAQIGLESPNGVPVAE